MTYVGKADKNLIMKCPLEYPNITKGTEDHNLGIAFQQDFSNKIENVLIGLTNLMETNSLICHDCDRISSWIICSS